MKIYIAGPLFSDIEKKRNREMRDAIQQWGYSIYLPQEDGKIALDLIKKGGNVKAMREKVFKNDIKAIESCDVMVCILDGRVPDEGLCVELGIAYAKGKKCIGYKTDPRTFDKYGNNLMIDGCLITTVNSMRDLQKVLESKI